MRCTRALPTSALIYPSATHLVQDVEGTVGVEQVVLDVLVSRVHAPQVVVVTLKGGQGACCVSARCVCTCCMRRMRPACACMRVYEPAFACMRRMRPACTCMHLRALACARMRLHAPANSTDDPTHRAELEVADALHRGKELVDGRQCGTRCSVEGRNRPQSGAGAGACRVNRAR